MTTTVPHTQAPVDDADPEAVADLVDALVRHVRAAHVLKTQVARAQTEAERAMHTVLFVLHEAGPQRVSALAERLATDPSTTSRQTAELVKRGLLERLPDPDDRRASLLAVTEQGCGVVASMRARRHELLGGAVAGWTAADMRSLTDLLHRFTDGLDRTRDALVSSRPHTLPPDSPTNAQETP